MVNETIPTYTGSGAVKLPSYAANDKGLEARLGENGMAIMKTKFLGRNDAGNIIETPQERFYTIARTMAESERQFGMTDAGIDQLTERYYDMFSSLEFLPGGRVITNTGKKDIALFNCYVLPVSDSIDDIYDSVKKAAGIHKQGGGTGYNFSQLRPRGSYVKKSQGVASGPVSFIDQFDLQTAIINSGNRRGANMGILNIDHPDILDFIYAKTSESKLKNFNISVGITDDFMQKVKDKSFYQLVVFEKSENKKPLTIEELKIFIANIEKNKAGADVGEKARPHSLLVNGSLVYNVRTKQEIGRVNSGIVELDATKIFDLIANLAHQTADPGMIFLDRIAEHNPIPSQKLDATNPCGEQPLHPYDACNLGSLNLARFVDGRKIDYQKLERRITDVIRFMDSVNDASVGPIPEIEKSVKNNRRIGLGVMGFADMLISLGIRYDSEEGLKTAEDVMKFINEKAYAVSKDLANEKGPFPNIGISIYKETGEKLRNIQRTTIAPTGSISMLAGVSSGIEPNFAVTFRKNMRGGDSAVYFNSLLEQIAKERGFYSDDLVKKIDENNGTLEGMLEIPEDVRNIVRTAMQISPEWHVRMQAAFQKHVENAVSKTINLPNNATVDDVKGAYLLAWNEKLKGITVYRDGSKSVQVLDLGTTKKKELARGEIEVLEEVMDSKYFKQKTPWGVLHVHVDHNAKGSPKQVFAQLGKAGEVVSADLEAIARLTSVGLRMGATIPHIVAQLEGIGSSKAVPTRDGQISSISDGLAVVLKKYEEIQKSGKKEIDLKELSEKIKETSINGHSEYAENCPTCGAKLKADSGCWSCSANCGFSRC